MLGAVLGINDDLIMLGVESFFDGDSKRVCGDMFYELRALKRSSISISSYCSWSF